MSTDARGHDETEAHSDRAMNPSAMSSTRMEYNRGDKMVETFFEHNKSRSRSLYDLMTLFMMQYGPTASVSAVLREVQAQRLLGFTEHSSPVPQITTPAAQAPEPTPAPAKKKKPAPKAAVTKTAAPAKTAPAPQPAPEPVVEDADVDDGGSGDGGGEHEVIQSAPAPSAAAQALAADFFGDDGDGGDEVVAQVVVGEAPVEEESDTGTEVSTDTETDTDASTDEGGEEEDFFAGMRR